MYCSPKRYRKDVKEERDGTKSNSSVGHRRHKPDDHHEPLKRKVGPILADQSSGQMKACGECFLTNYRYIFSVIGIIILVRIIETIAIFLAFYLETNCFFMYCKLHCVVDL